MWTNSLFGRILCTATGVYFLILPFSEAPRNGEQTALSFLVGSIIFVVGAAVLVAVWTSRLVLAGGVLTATNFFISRSVPLVDVIDVDPSAFPFLGMKIRRADKSGIRTLVSGRTWDELWVPRAAKIAEEIGALAQAARDCASCSSDRSAD